MYLDTFRLTRAPFDVCSDVEFVYVGPGQQETLTGLQQACSEQDTLTLVTAPEGSGKSTLLDKFLADLDDNVLWSEVRGRWTDPEEFLQAVIIGFGFEDCSGDLKQLRRILEVFLTHQRRRGNVPVLVVEDAQTLSPKVLEEVRWLAGLVSGEHAAVNVVLSGLPELERIVGSPAMEVLSKRRRHRLQVKAFDAEETAAYITHRLKMAGSLNPAALFSADAVAAVFRYTGGAPGLINTLCETALNCAAARGEPSVTTATVEAAAGKLHVVYDAGTTRVQGMRSTDAKAIRQDELARLIITHEDQPPKEYRVVRERVLIGRKASNDVQLDSRGVSRHHALMLLDAEGWWLFDLHSRNGTLVNSRSVRQRRLGHNDIIQIADFRIRCLHKLVPHSLVQPPAASVTAAVDAREIAAQAPAEPAKSEQALPPEQREPAGEAQAVPGGGPPARGQRKPHPRPRLVKSS